MNEIDYRKKHRIQLIFNIILAIGLITCIFLIIFLNNTSSPLSPSEIFESAQYSVVELRSQLDSKVVSYGSAVFIEDDGTLVSNAHMVTYKEAGTYHLYEKYDIRFSYEKEYRSVSLVKYDLEQDISILMLNDLSDVKFRAINTADSSIIKSGDKVYAVGNALNHGIGITQGIVSLPQVNIEIEDNVRNVIQCDLIINEGNSGGALLNEDGALIGITTFRLKDSLGNVIYGVAFSIPINLVMEFLTK